MSISSEDFSISRRPNLKYKESDTYVLPSCIIGIELELENVNGFHAPGNYKEWSLVEDGSVRHNGLELVSPPIFGEDIDTCLHQLKGFINESGGTEGPSAALHIHMDMRDMPDLDHVLRFAGFFSVFERTLFNYVGEERKKNIYCIPISDSTEYKREMSALFHAQSKDEYRAVYPSQDYIKYSSMNVFPLLHQGSIEVRMHPSTTDINAIRTWINILMCIKKYALTSPIDIETMPSFVSSERNTLVETVFGQYAELLVYDSIQQDLQAGARDAQEILNSSALERKYGAGAEDIEESLAATLFSSRGIKKKLSPIYTNLPDMHMPNMVWVDDVESN